MPMRSGFLDGRDSDTEHSLQFISFIKYIILSTILFSCFIDITLQLYFIFIFPEKN